MMDPQKWQLSSTETPFSNPPQHGICSISFLQSSVSNFHFGLPKQDRNCLLLLMNFITHQGYPTHFVTQYSYLRVLGEKIRE